MKLEMCL